MDARPWLASPRCTLATQVRTPLARFAGRGHKKFLSCTPRQSTGLRPAQSHRAAVPLCMGRAGVRMFFLDPCEKVFFLSTMPGGCACWSSFFFVHKIFLPIIWVMLSFLQFSSKIAIPLLLLCSVLRTKVINNNKSHQILNPMSLIHFYGPRRAQVNNNLETEGVHQMSCCIKLLF